jgi:ribose transport system permease protein
MRSPAFDLAYRMPGFRRRMLKRIPRDEWLYPSMNYGCVLKLSDDGEVVESLWDPGGAQHANVTSMREYDGHLYIGGLENNRIGRIPLPANAAVCTCGQPPCQGRRTPAEDRYAEAATG